MAKQTGPLWRADSLQSSGWAQKEVLQLACKWGMSAARAGYYLGGRIKIFYSLLKNAGL
jgi:hypothetical protein